MTRVSALNIHLQIIYKQLRINGGVWVIRFINLTLSFYLLANYILNLIGLIKAGVENQANKLLSWFIFILSMSQQWQYLNKNGNITMCKYLDDIGNTFNKLCPYIKIVCSLPFNKFGISYSVCNKMIKTLWVCLPYLFAL